MRLMKVRCWFVVLALLGVGACQAQPMMPPAFLGGMPGMAQMQAIVMQRHQARTLLYREAIEELRKNPQAADVPGCPPKAMTTRTLCIRRPAKAAVATPEAGSTPSVSGEQAILPADLPLPATRRRLAVLFGNNAYIDPIPRLNTPIEDVEKIAEVLRKQYGYETRVVRDASKAAIIQALNQVADEARPEDSVLLFYAGHGYLMEDTKMGYWIPVDGSVKTAENWVSNSDISKLLQAITARQVMLISDSCFSGSLTREQKMAAVFATKGSDVLRRRSVLAFSSGDEEPVSDEGQDGHSVFAGHFIKTLEGVSGSSLGYEIYRQVRDKVVKDYPQEPQYGAVFSAGHVSGGEYLFDAK